MAHQTLKDFPEALDNALQFWEVYPLDKELPKKMLELHISVLAVFWSIPDFYHHSRSEISPHENHRLLC